MAALRLFFWFLPWSPHAYTRLRLASGSVTSTRADTPTNKTGADALFFHTPPRHRASTMAASCLLPLDFYLVVFWEPHAYTRLRLASGSVTGTRADTPTNKTGADALFFHTSPRHRASTMAAGYEKRHLSVSFVLLVGLNRLELSTSRLSGVCSNQLSYNPLVPLSGGLWWRCTDSNRGPLECKSSALPTELHPQSEC